VDAFLLLQGLLDLDGGQFARLLQELTEGFFL
jgi:hypothetical protein